RERSVKARDRAQGALLQVLVVRPGAAFGRDPGDDLVRVLDIAGLAVHAVGRVDLQPAAGGVLDHLVDARRTEARARVAVLHGATLDTDAGVVHHQVHRLVLVVRRRGEIHALQAVARRQRALHVVALRLLVLAQFVERAPVRPVAQRPRREPAGDRLPRGVEHAEPQATLEPRLDVADGAQLLHRLRRTQLRVETVAVQRARRCLRCDMFGGEHPRADRLVGAIDLWHVEQPRTVADEQCTGHLHPGQRLETAGAAGTGARREEDAASGTTRRHP